MAKGYKKWGYEFLTLPGVAFFLELNQVGLALDKVFLFLNLAVFLLLQDPVLSLHKNRFQVWSKTKQLTHAFR